MFCGAFFCFRDKDTLLTLALKPVFERALRHFIHAQTAVSATISPHTAYGRDGRVAT